MIGSSRIVSRRSLGAGLVVSALVIIAIVLRLWQLGELPFGFHPDEGHNALDAWRIAEGWRPVFLERNNGREPLYMYLMAGIMAMTGPSIWSARLAGVVVAALLVPAQYLLVRSLPLERPATTALVSAGLIAVTFWPIAQARYALRANLLPLTVTLLLWSWWRAARTTGAHTPAAEGRQVPVCRQGPLRHLGPVRCRQLCWGAAAGVFLAASAYTHLTGRLLFIPLVASGLWIARREERRGVLPAMAAALVVAVLLSAPLIAWFADHPQMLSYRAGQVSVLNPEVNEGDLLAEVADNTWRLLRAPFTTGDTSWYHNLSGRPVFRPPAALALLIGVLLLARDALSRRSGRAQSAALLLAVTLVVTAAASWASVGAPNYVRLTGVWPVLFLLPAWGLERSAALIDRLNGSRSTALSVGNALIAGVLVLGAVWSVWDYFVVYRASDEVRGVFNAAAVERGYQVAELAQEGPLYVSPAIWNQSVIRFVNLNDPPASFDIRDGLVLPPEGDGRYALDPAEAASARAVALEWPVSRSELTDSRGHLSLVLLELARADWPAPDNTFTPPPAFGDYIALLAAEPQQRTVEPGGVVTVTLEWLALAPTPLDMSAFVHLESPSGETCGQWDGPPLGGRYTTDEWGPGERIVMKVGVPVDEHVPAGQLSMRTGWYDWRTVERLDLRDLPGSSFEIGTVDVNRNFR